jgi:hypothetical protein
LIEIFEELSKQKRKKLDLFWEIVYRRVDWVSLDELLRLILDNFDHREFSMKHSKRLFVKHMEKEMVTEIQLNLQK